MCTPSSCTTTFATGRSTCSHWRFSERRAEWSIWPRSTCCTTGCDPEGASRRASRVPAGPSTCAGVCGSSSRLGWVGWRRWLPARRGAQAVGWPARTTRTPIRRTFWTAGQRQARTLAPISWPWTVRQPTPAFHLLGGSSCCPRSRSMPSTAGRVSAATSSPAWARGRVADARVSATSTSPRQGSPASSAGWVACSDPSAATSAGFPRPAQWRRGRAGVGVPVRQRYHPGGSP
jgi:hypothetical protein